MARKRMIDPEFWSDEKIGNLSLEARLLFIGMWNFADDEGIIKARPEYLRSIIFPYDNLSLDRLSKSLNELLSQGLIYSYEVNGQHFILIKNFNKHQTINRPVPSKYPKPPTQLTESSVSPHTHLTDEIKINKDNINKDNIKEKEINKEKESTGITHTPKKTYSNLSDLLEEDFLEISERYNFPLTFVKSKYEDMCLWAGEKTGRDKGRNWKLTLMNWVKRDGIKIIERSKTEASFKKGGVVDGTQI